METGSSNAQHSPAVIVTMTMKLMGKEATLKPHSSGNGIAVNASMYFPVSHSGLHVEVFSFIQHCVSSLDLMLKQSQWATLYLMV